VTEPAPIFRAGALRGQRVQARPRAAWLGPRHRAGAIQTGPWWMTGGYWVLLALLAAGLAAGLAIQVDSHPLIVTLVTGLTSGAADG
jgi:hypothetical protein